VVGFEKLPGWGDPKEPEMEPTGPVGYRKEVSDLALWGEGSRPNRTPPRSRARSGSGPLYRDKRMGPSESFPRGRRGELSPLPKANRPGQESGGTGSPRVRTPPPGKVNPPQSVPIGGGNPGNSKGFPPGPGHGGAPLTPLNIGPGGAKHRYLAAQSQWSFENSLNSEAPPCLSGKRGNPAA